ncbi:hypothetical protein SAMN05444354_12796 [Stigmatella aurantiaca]|uniref:Lipoprotein n=1 Tax=Stigmatella aurantiaca TaxID=41 RepID=A0A1H8CW27_STIAU|nr:hypothetical protein [Stigmatella aurantiaca]SEM99089.1 hypothetical protein SAMN05444354_12796 [Stigmatella aurantiaca]
MTRLLLCVLALSAVSACGSDSKEPLRQGRLTLREGSSLDELAECGVDLPSCSLPHRNCVYMTLDGVTKARCVDLKTLCTDYLACTGGTECAILESFPSQAVCTGTCDGDACDEPVSNSGP